MLAFVLVLGLGATVTIYWMFTYCRGWADNRGNLGFTLESSGASRQRFRDKGTNIRRPRL